MKRMRRGKVRPGDVEGWEQVRTNLQRELNRVEGKTLRGMIRAAIRIFQSMNETPPTVPIDTSNLVHSWFVVTSRGSVEEGQSPEFTGENAGELRGSHETALSAAQALAKKQRGPAVVFGFSANYAVFVHEMVEGGKPINWNRPGSGPKFFQAALTRESGEILSILRQEARIP